MGIRIYVPKHEEDFRRQYYRAEACYVRLYELRHKTPFVCGDPDCRGTRWREVKRTTAVTQLPKPYRVCQDCHRQESVLAGTCLQGIRINLQDLCKLFWLAAGAREGFDVGWLQGGRAKKLGFLLGNRGSYYRCVALIRRVMTLAQPRLCGRVELSLVSIAHPQARKSAPKKWVALAVETGGQQRLRCGLLLDPTPASLAKFLHAAVVPNAQVCLADGIGAEGISASDWLEILGKLVGGISQTGATIKIRRQLQQWLAKVGWPKIDVRNLAGYLGEFVYRYNERGTQGSILVRLLRLALSAQSFR